MARVSDQVIVAAAQGAGWRLDDLATAVAVALAESGGDTTATHHNTNGSTDYGLWQVNSVHYGGQAPPNWSDPAANAQAAHAVWARQGWNAWTVYKLQLPYLARMPEARAAVTRYGSGLGTGVPGVGSVGDAVGGTVQAGQNAVQLAARAGTWASDPGSWLRVVYVMIGAVMVAGAVIVVAGKSLPPVRGALGGIVG